VAENDSDVQLLIIEVVLEIISNNKLKDGMNVSDFIMQNLLSLKLIQDCLEK